MSISNLSSYSENGYQSRLTESCDDYASVLAVTQHLWNPTPLESLAPEFVTPSASKNAENTSFQRSHSMGITEGYHDRTNVVETDMSQNPATTSNRSQRGGASADDERFIRRSVGELRKETDWRMEFVWYAVGRLLNQVDCCNCPKIRELWLNIIKGNVDDDMWLWVDGDEDWLAKQDAFHWVFLDPTDWVNAQLALRRRITRQRYPPMTARNEKVRNATPHQRFYAIAWLITSSRAVAELFASHGRTPPTFRTPEIAESFNYIIGAYWSAFPSQTSTWESALMKSKEDGCICSLPDCHGVNEWFDMMVWLEDVPPILEVGYERACVRCQSLLESRYEDVAAKFTVTLRVSLVDAFCDYCTDADNVTYSRRLSLTAKSLTDRTLEPLMKKHRRDMRYVPSVNRFPERLRPWVTKLLCVSNPSCEDTQAQPTTGLPDNIFDGVRDPWVVLGIIALVTCRDSTDKGTDSHDKGWHSHLSSFLYRSLQCFDMPVLPRLSSTSLTLCRALDQDYSEERLLGQFVRAIDDSDWVKLDQDGRQLRLTTAVMVAVTTFLRNKDVNLYSCRRCEVVSMEFFAGTPSAVRFEVVNFGDRDSVLGGGLSSPSQGSLELGMQEPAWMVAFTSMLRNPTLSKDEIHSRLARELHRLRQYFDSFGLDMANCFQRSDSGNGPSLRKSTLPRRLPGRSISSSSKLSKSDKVEEIKDRLLEMLRELDLPYERLPWYTLEKDLKKHRCALVNWPAGVLRKRGNRGIHDMSAVEANTLYEAITCPDESHRLRICRCPSPLAVVPVQPANHTPAAASGSKRPVEELDLPGHPSKRIRFKDMTSKVSQQQLSDLRVDGASRS